MTRFLVCGQVMSILGPRMARVYSQGSTTSCSSYSSSTSSGSTSSGSSGSYSSGSSMCTLSTDEDGATAPDAAAAFPPVLSAAAAAAIERLLLHAAEQLAPSYTAQALSFARDAGSSAVSTATYAPLLKLLEVSATITRNCARGSSAGGPAVSLTDSVTTLAAATAAEDGARAGAGSTPSAFVDRLVRKLHPMCAAAAPVCAPGQLLVLMAAWTQLGFSAAWRFGGFRRGYKRLGQQRVVQSLSSAELASAVETVAKLPRTQAVVQTLAAEVLRRQRATQQPQQQQQQQGLQGAQQEWSDAGDDQQAAATTESPVPAVGAAAQVVQPLSAPQLLAVVCAVPGLHPMWPVDATLLLLQQVQGAVLGALNPSQQWRLWNAVQQLQQQWKPSVVAAAAAAAAATDSVARMSPAASSAADSANVNAGAMHPSVTFAAAAAAASLKAAAAPTADGPDASSGAEEAALSRPVLPSLSAAAAAARSSSVQGAVPAQAVSQPQQQQQQLMRLLDELQDQVAAALARVQPDPDALPLEAAPVKLPRPLQSAQQWSSVAPAEGRLLQREAGKLTEQQVLAAFAKAQKSLLNPHCSGPTMVKVLEGLLLLLAVPRYAKAGEEREDSLDETVTCFAACCSVTLPALS